jgi:hypothetical protein
MSGNKQIVKEQHRQDEIHYFESADRCECLAACLRNDYKEESLKGQ